VKGAAEISVPSAQHAVRRAPLEHEAHFHVQLNCNKHLGLIKILSEVDKIVSLITLKSSYGFRYASCLKGACCPRPLID